MNPRVTLWATRARMILSRRSQRERVLILIMVATILSYGLGNWVFRPLLAMRAEALGTIRTNEAILARLAAAPPAESRIAATDNRPVPVIATETAPQFDLTIRRLEPEGQGARLVLEDADYAKIITWLDSLVRDHGLRIGDVEMDRRPDPGMVSAQLTLVPGGG